MSKLCDLTGKTIGNFLIERRIQKHDLEYDNNHSKYVCSCLLCGRTEIIMRGDKLRAGQKTHIGCTEYKRRGKDEECVYIL